MRVRPATPKRVPQRKHLRALPTPPPTPDAHPFDALLRQVPDDPTAAAALVQAYDELGETERDALVDAVLKDTQGEEHAGAAIALLLSVEEESERASRLAVALGASQPRADEGPARRGYAWGGHDEGGLVIVRERTELFVDALRVAWKGEAPLEVKGITGHLANENATLLERFDLPLSAEEIAYERAVDRLARLLWQRQRAGDHLPPELAAFVDLFEPACAPAPI